MQNREMFEPKIAIKYLQIWQEMLIFSKKSLKPCSVLLQGHLKSAEKPYFRQIVILQILKITFFHPSLHMAALNTGSFLIL